MGSRIEPVSGRTMGFGRGRFAPTLRGAAAVLLLAITSGCAYDDLAAQQDRITEAWTGVERELDRRSVLLGDLMPVVRANAAGESALLAAVADARARMLAATARDDRMAAARVLADAATRLVALGDRHPALRADPRFVTLTAEVAAVDRRLAAEQQRFNAAVRAYNHALDAFPTRLYASLLGFDAAPYLDASGPPDGGLPLAAAPRT